MGEVADGVIIVAVVATVRLGLGGRSAVPACVYVGVHMCMYMVVATVGGRSAVPSAPIPVPCTLSLYPVPCTPEHSAVPSAPVR